MNPRSTYARTALCCFLTFGLISTDLLAQKQATAPPDWSRVQSLRTGERVEVHRIKKKKISGTIVAVTFDSVTVEQKGSSSTIPKSEIKKLKVESAAQRTNNALIGAGIGVAGGVTTAVILDGALTDGNGTSSAAAALFSAVGGFVGFLIPIMHRAYRTIYQGN
jgi:hypothetical protein